MKKVIILFIYILTSNTIYSQLYKAHKWEEKPVFSQLTNEEQKLPSIGIKEKYIIQYHQALFGSLSLFETYHRIIRVNTDKGIKQHNRIYIPMRNVKSIIDLKARVIHSDGTITLFNKNNIKELDNVKEYGNIKIFAIEGLQKNTQLEVLYTLNKNLSTLGSVNIQQNYTIKEAEVIIRKPYNLITKIKSYNGFPEFEQKKVEGNKIAYTATAKNILPMVKEPFSTSKANKMRVVYLTTNGTGSLNTEWNNFASRIRNNFIQLNLKKNKNILKDFQKKETLNTKNKNAIINSIVNYVQNNFLINKKNNHFSELKEIFSTKSATDISIAKVYAYLFKQYKIDYNIVFTSNRFYSKFDETFFTNSNLNYMMFFLPETNKYLCPAEKTPYLGYPPVRYSNNDGIFINASNHTFSKIETANMNYTLMDRVIDAKVNIDEETIIVDGTYKVTGYRAYNSRRAYEYYKNNNVDKYKTMEAASGIEDAEFEEFNVKNEEIDKTAENLPLIINYKYKSEEILEEVNNNYILNVGRLIGTQSELYQEEERINSVELYNPNAYSYIIKVKIPEGYTPTNLNSLNINTSFNIDEKLAAHFISLYKIEKDEIVITISEKYPLIDIPISFYKNFKEVINSAYDFSQTNIIFNKKK